MMGVFYRCQQCVFYAVFWVYTAMAYIYRYYALTNIFNLNIIYNINILMKYGENHE